MPRQTEPLSRHTVLLSAGQYERLQTIYGDSIGAAGVIRLLIKSHLEKTERAADKVAPKEQLLEGIDL